mgnify:CR=1 FL=1|tara:strand:- start:513 stop:1619 length:1107 start_codon:yes stop_codon:yes gene_type:complete
MKYCNNCILPDTRPNIFINPEGLCNSKCSSSLKKINWKKRKKDFIKLLKNNINKKVPYDCIIPVSGGKDSTWQVLMALKYNLRPLCITWKTPQRSDIGKKNLENLIDLGVDHIDYSINPSIEKQLIYRSFVLEGSPALTMHMAIHNIPRIFADKFKVPLILWGENSAFEYGTNDENLKGSDLTYNWRKKFGNLPKNFSKISKGINQKYLYPYVSHLKKKDSVKEVFLGHYFSWDPVKIYKIVKRKGFLKNTKPFVGLYDFADIDDLSIITVHHWMKWYKFGFTRLWDNLSIEIREGRISRNNAIKIIQKQSSKIPSAEIKNFCKYLNISNKNFFKIAEKHRNKRIWFENKKKNFWYIKNFLIKNYKWK